MTEALPFGMTDEDLSKLTRCMQDVIRDSGAYVGTAGRASVRVVRGDMEVDDASDALSPMWDARVVKVEVTAAATPNSAHKAGWSNVVTVELLERCALGPSGVLKMLLAKAEKDMATLAAKGPPDCSGTPED